MVDRGYDAVCHKYKVSLLDATVREVPACKLPVTHVLAVGIADV